MATEDTINMWKDFPKLVRNDVCFSMYRNHLQCENENAQDEVLTINMSEFITEEELPIKDSVRNVKEATKEKIISKRWKYALFLAIWLFSAWHLLTVAEKVLIEHSIEIDSSRKQSLNLSYSDYGPQFSVKVIGPFRESSNSTTNYLHLAIYNKDLMTISKAKVYEFVKSNGEMSTFEFDFSPEIISTRLNLTFLMSTNVEHSIAFKLVVDAKSVNPEVGVISAIIILIFFNVLVNAEIVHRTVAAVFTTFTSIGILAALDDRPSMNDVVTWIDCETLLLMLSMMVLVAILSNSGFFEYVALYAFQISRGQIWPLINILCVVSAIISMFIDNVTTILLITPVVIKLFECLNLDPAPILPFIILNINIGGLATLIGHPPNLLITENTYVTQYNVNFLTYAMHMSVGVILAPIQTNIHLRIQCRNVPKKIKCSMNEDGELELWQKCFDDIEPNEKNEETKNLKSILANKIDSLKEINESARKKGLIHRHFDKKMFPSSFEQLRNSHPITNRRLFRKGSIILMFIIALFFIETIPILQRLSLGWCAFMGVVLLLVISDFNTDAIVHQVEWLTLIFFGSMFITMECLSRLGLMKWIGKQTEYLILLGDERFRLASAIIIILWLSALSSSVIDSTPVTAMMVKVLDSFAQNKELNLPVKPIVFALAFGPTLGANGNLYGASSNILCLGISEKLGHTISSNDYFKIGFPVMIGNVLLITAYLLIAHVLLEWH